MTIERPPAGGDVAVPPAGRTSSAVHPARFADQLHRSARAAYARNVLSAAGLTTKLVFVGGVACEVIVRGPGSVSYRVVPWGDAGNDHFPPVDGFRVWHCALGLAAPELLADTPTAERATAVVLDHLADTTTL